MKSTPDGIPAMAFAQCGFLSDVQISGALVYSHAYLPGAYTPTTSGTCGSVAGSGTNDLYGPAVVAAVPGYDMILIERLQYDARMCGGMLVAAADTETRG